MSGTPWTAQVVRRLHLLLEQRPALSYSNIAWRLNVAHGTAFTKNAVIGYTRRTGMAPRKPATEPMVNGQIPRARTREARPPSDHGKLNLLELRNNECRWPFGDGDFTFCGKLQLDNCSYCLEHAHAAYPALARLR